MKTKIKNILILQILLFSLVGCDPIEETWTLEIVNNLSYPIFVYVADKKDSYNSGSTLIPPRKNSFVWLSSKMPLRVDEGVHRISVFSEDRKLLMLIEGEQLNQYVILKGESIDDILEGRDPNSIFSFEVKREYIETDSNNKTNFEYD